MQPNLIAEEPFTVSQIFSKLEVSFMKDTGILENRFDHTLHIQLPYISQIRFL